MAVLAGRCRNFTVQFEKAQSLMADALFIEPPEYQRCELAVVPSRTLTRLLSRAEIEDKVFAGIDGRKLR
jgi:hypothetical protein